MAENTSKTILQQLYEDKPLRTKVDNLLDEGKTLSFIREFCENSQGFLISTSSLDNYKKKREEAIRKGVSLGSLIDKRRNTGEVIELHSADAESLEGTIQNDLEPQETKLTSTLEFLESIIGKSMNAINQVDMLDPALGLKAITEYTKITGAQGGGLTLHGIQELRLQHKAFETAIATVIMEYIPKEKHEEVMQRFEEREQEFYQNLDVTEEGRRKRKALQDIGVL